MHQFVMQQFLREEASAFDIVLIDCPPNLYRCSWTAMIAADYVIIPVPPEDFGTQAEDPSHPKLLDWLAIELIDSGWSMKHVHKQIVLSKTFAQSARVTPDRLEADAENRLLSRGPRFRVPAEFIRDNALAISGILSTKMYGPPIMPHQPSDIWRSVGQLRSMTLVIRGEDSETFTASTERRLARCLPQARFVTIPDAGHLVAFERPAETGAQIRCFLEGLDL